MSNIQIYEVNEAIEAGENLLRVIDGIDDTLKKAKTWGFIDMFSDHSLITSIFKHSRLHEAQDGIQQLQYALNRFNSELQDVRIENNLEQISMSKGIEIADWLIDGIIMDAYTLQRIYKSSKELGELRSKVVLVLNNLQQIKSL